MPVCTYDIAANGCFLEITEQPSGDLIRQLNLATISWIEQSDDNFQLRDGDGNTFSEDIDNINGYATRALLFAFIDPLRAGCALQPPGGGAGPPTQSNGTATNIVVVGAGAAATAAGLQGVAITNVGTAPGLVLGATIFPGQTLEYGGYFNRFSNDQVFLPAISYDALTTTLSIQTFV